MGFSSQSRFCLIIFQAMCFDLLIQGQSTCGAIPCWKCQLHKRLGMLFSSLAFLLFNVVGMSRKGWRHLYSVPIKEVCHGGVACSLLKLDGGLQATPSITKFLSSYILVKKRTQASWSQPRFCFCFLRDHQTFETCGF